MDATHTISDYDHTALPLEAPLPERRVENARADEEPIDLLPARGILVAVLIGAAMWAVILAVGWLIFR